MNRRTVAWGLLVLLFVATNLSARELTVACWNVHNYGIKDRHLEGIYRPEYPKPEAEKTAVRDALHSLSADVLVLQEIGGEAFLEELRRDLAAEGLDYPHWAVLTRPGEVHALAVLSREPLSGMRLMDHLDFKYQSGRQRVKRGLMELHFETAGVSWVLFNLHLKSRRTVHEDDLQSRQWREREARVIRDYIRENYPSNASVPYLVMGDFNAHINDDPLERFLEVSKSELMREVPLKDEMGCSWTYFNSRSRVYEQVDYILANPFLWSDESPVRVLSAGIAPARFEESGALEGSDHRMLYVVLKFVPPEN